ncbi:MAG TPA: carbonic anhydrase [Mycobacteriales bacterium]
MTSIDAMQRANSAYAATHVSSSGRPTSGLVVVTCMDARIDTSAMFGIEPGQAHVLRNAGGVVTDDVLRSLVVSQRKLGTTEIALVHHSGCGQTSYTDDELAAELAAEGAAPSWRAHAFTDPAVDVRAGLDVVRNCPWLPHRDAVRGFVLDVETGLLTEVR